MCIRDRGTGQGYEQSMTRRQGVSIYLVGQYTSKLACKLLVGSKHYIGMRKLRKQSALLQCPCTVNYLEWVAVLQSMASPANRSRTASCSHRSQIHWVLDDLEVVRNIHRLGIDGGSKRQGIRPVEERIDESRDLLQPFI